MASNSSPQRKQRATIRLSIGWIPWVFQAVVVGHCLAGWVHADDNLERAIRRPVAMLKLPNSSHLAVVNSRSGTVSLFDYETRRVTRETRVAQQLAGGHVVQDGTLLLIDPQAHKLLVGRADHLGVDILGRVAVPQGAVSVVGLETPAHCAVASTWAHRVTVVSFEEPASPRVVRTIDLRFPPRLLRTLPNDQLLVTDAFGGRVALIDVATGKVRRVRELNATHNIAGMTVSDRGETVYLAHQMLNHEAPTTGPNVHWGDVMSNVIRRCELAWFLSDEPEQTTADQIYYLGYPDRAAADPTGLIITPSEKFIVAFAGVSEVAISDRGLNHFARPTVGRRPMAMWMDDEAGRLYVANHLDDSISILNVPRARLIETVPLGPTPELTLAEEGERWFYDASLSSDGWFSCHSCHTNGHSNGQLSDTFGDGYRGSPKRVLSLLGAAETAPWAWNGKMHMLESQVRKSIETTMRGPEPTAHQVQALVAFMMTLEPPPSVTAARGELDSKSIGQGQAVFQELGCAECHSPPHYTANGVFDVGLTDPEGQHLFNPPSLLGLSHRDRLLHDNRAKTIKEALKIHPFGAPTELPDEQWHELKAFLNSL